MTKSRRRFNPPPGWPPAPSDWEPPRGWTPDPSWPPPPPGGELWVTDTEPQGPDQHSEGSPSITRKSAPEPNVPARPDRVSFLEAEVERLKAQLQVGRSVSAADLVLLDDEMVLQEVGIYRYHHPLENAAAYRDRLRELSSRIAASVKAGEAIESSSMFTFDNSLAKGRRMTKDLAKLMLRAYNAEADNSIRSLRAGNVQTGKKRLEASRASIAKLGKMMEMRISEAFHSLRLEEIELTADYLMRKQEEREAAREERARLREEKKVAAELAAEREKLEKERKHILNTLLTVREGGGDDPELAERLRELESAIEFNDYRAANIRAGYVYVISNRGAFGEHMVKIGLTRRLEPQERVTELGGASVPFRFDVHALFFSEDAVGLEANLHQHFADRRVNRANSRKEFFFATPAEVRDVLESRLGNLLEFTERAESLEYLQSVRYWPDSVRANRDRRSGDPGVS